MDGYQIAIGFGVSAICGLIVNLIVVDWLLEQKLYPRASTPTDQAKSETHRTVLRIATGILERLFYTFILWIGFSELVGAWVIFKSVGRWHEKRRLEDRHAFFLGNLISLFFGVLGWWIINDFRYPTQ